MLLKRQNSEGKVTRAAFWGRNDPILIYMGDDHLCLTPLRVVLLITLKDSLLRFNLLLCLKIEGRTKDFGKSGNKMLQHERNIKISQVHCRKNLQILFVQQAFS